MNLIRLNEIKEKIEKGKLERARSEGAIEKIVENWKKKYNISTLEEAEEKVAKLNREIEATEQKIEGLSEKLEDITDWDLI